MMIEASSLVKRYSGVIALGGLNLGVEPGSIHGFLGRNGAGKTTTIRILVGMTRPDSGKASVFGLDATDPYESVEIRRRAAFVGEDKGLYAGLNALELIRFTASFYPKWDRALERRYMESFAIPPYARIRDYSTGMRTRLSLLLALCRGTELMVLDEPTAGLDPLAADQILQAIVAFTAEQGGAVFFSSHDIAEVEQIADTVTIIDGGRSILCRALDDLTSGWRRIRIVFDGPAPADFTPSGVVRAERAGRVLTLLVDSDADRVLAAAQALDPVSAEAFPASLKDIFLELVTNRINQETNHHAA